ncbi:unnamed protein product [Citrullus colocynthis]|uniref:Uncharacterized protein n=1 Tax=Citrullus colocynthis TaxID=252529 RepID=A0ABP0XNH7_9ROSI
MACGRSPFDGRARPEKKLKDRARCCVLGLARQLCTLASLQARARGVERCPGSHAYGALGARASNCRRQLLLIDVPRSISSGRILSVLALVPHAMEASRLVRPFLSAPLVGCMTNPEARIVFRFGPSKARRGPRRRCSLSRMQCIRRHHMVDWSRKRDQFGPWPKPMHSASAEPCQAPNGSCIRDMLSFS